MSIERASHAKQDELREEAREMQRLILTKNDEADERKVRPPFSFISFLCADPSA